MISAVFYSILNLEKDWQLRIVGPDDGYLPKLNKLIRDFNLKRVKIINPKYGDQKNLEY